MTVHLESKISLKTIEDESYDEHDSEYEDVEDEEGEQSNEICNPSEVTSMSNASSLKVRNHTIRFDCHFY